MYQFNSRIRYSETGEDGCLTLTGVINYLQDCSTFHSEDKGIGVNFQAFRKRAWMLSSWRIFIHRYPRLGEDVCIGTWPYGSKGIYGYRNFVLLDKEGNHLVEADSSWFLLDLSTAFPIKLTEEDLKEYGLPEPCLEMGKAARKISLPLDCEKGKPIEVCSHHIDTNHHVNNAQYVEFARQAASVHTPIGELRADYRKAAVLGDILYPQISREADTITVGLLNEQGKTFAAVWMKKMKNPGGG